MSSKLDKKENKIHICKVYFTFNQINFTYENQNE